MRDSFNRNITYLRISVTDRCNLQCSYCIPKDGVQLIAKDKLISVSEIVEVTKEAVGIGISKIRLTGGEPLVHPEILSIIREIKAIKGITELSLTTNGVLLKSLAEKLKKAGLDRVNISLDTVDPHRFRSLTQKNELHKVLEGIEEAQRQGLTPIKINCVVFKDAPYDNINELKEFAIKNDLKVRFIHQMNLKTGEFSQVQGGDGGNCAICNRLRLTSDGNIKPCLFSAQQYSIRELGAKQALLGAIKNKPECGSFNKSNEFYNIGG
jgi:cyclic pyranopterin phosphate synthase